VAADFQRRIGDDRRPANAGAAAILRYREIVTDDIKGFETEYRRIEILNDGSIHYFDR